MTSENKKFIEARDGLMNSKAFILFYYDEKADQFRIAKDIHRLNLIEVAGFSQLIDNYATELLSCFGNLEEDDASNA